MTTADSIAAVVVAYNGGDELLDCLRSLLTQTVADLEVIVVDNASSDGSIERAETEFADAIRIIRRTTNGGYAAAANTGWRSTDAPVVAILNQDLTFAPDCLEEMRRVLTSESRDALVTPKLVLKSDPTRVNAIGNDVHMSCVAWCHGLNTPADDWHGVIEVTAISGAAFIAKRSLLEKLGGVEESYFMYMEDVDLSFRARLAGATCLAACDAVATHGWALALTPTKFGFLERNRRALWERFIGSSDGLWLVLLQAEVMAWVYAATRGRRFIRAKWQVRRTSIPRHAGTEAAALLPLLATRHPYAVLFPAWGALASVGAATDDAIRVAARALGYVQRITHQGQATRRSP